MEKMITFQHIIFIIILSGISVCNSYRILAIFPFNGRSHFNVLEPTAKALARKGHQVDVMSNFKLKEPFPNYTDLDFPTAEFEARVELNKDISTFDRHFLFESRICNLLGRPEISTLIKNPPKNPAYDVILVHIVTGYQCFAGIGYIWNIPVIGVVTTTLYIPFQTFIGNPLSLANSHDGYVNSYKQNLTFLDRVCNVIKSSYYLWNHDFYRLRQEPFLKKYLGPDIPSYRELEKNLALIFANSHYSFYGVKPNTPALIEIGGIHIHNDTTNLNSNLKSLLDKSHNGFIYFSFGSLTVLESLPPDVLNNLYTVFRKISPIKIIMRAKHSYTLPKNLSDNVFAFEWLPQQKLLEHPNIRAFVTHGGGLSTQEAIHYAVPVICIPLFAEQRTHCDIFSLKNMGRQIDLHTAKLSDYEDAFQEVLSNSQYKDSMKKFSQLYWDRPQSPQEAVNFWVEYVIRHGKNVLRSPAVDLEWWQFELIDVYCFLFSCVLVVIVLSISFIVFTFKIITQLYSSNKKNVSIKKSN